MGGNRIFDLIHHIQRNLKSFYIRKNYFLSKSTWCHFSEIDSASHFQWQSAIFVDMESKLGFISILEILGGNSIFDLILPYTVQFNKLYILTRSLFLVNLRYFLCVFYSLIYVVSF